MKGEKRKMQFNRRKSKATATALFLMFAIAISMVALPAVNAQAGWSIYIDATTSRIRGEVRLNNVRQQTTFTDIMLGVKAPGDTAWTYLGPFSTTNGRYDYTYTFTKAGTHQFQYIVPPQGALPTNPDTTDGKWYSEIDEVNIPTKKTYPYIGAMPNPAGVNQGILLHVGITDPHMGGVGYGWTGLSITITRPDNVVETLSDIMTDSTGGTGISYTPTMAGNYTLVGHFPEQMYSISTQMYLASDTPPLMLVVTDEPVQYHPGHALPTEYWTRPIDPQLREWYGIGGSWLESTPRNKFAIGNDYAPDTAHILWTKPLTSGGLEGGVIPLEASIGKGPVGYDTGDAYEGKFIERFILGGKLYYQKYATGDPYKEYVCVDLHTGEQLWSRVLLNNRTISFAQLMYWQTYDFMGVYDYLWCTGNAASFDMLGWNYTAALNATGSFTGTSDLGTIWLAFDPFTADFVWSLYEVPSGTRVMGQKNEILIYNIPFNTTTSATRGYMEMWNSTNIPYLYAGTTYNSMQWGQWRAMGKIQNATQAISRPTTPLGLSGYNWNVTIPKGLPGSVYTIFEGDRVIGGSLNTMAVRLWALNLNTSKGNIGDLLFNNTWNAPSEWAAGNVTVSGFNGGWMCWSPEDLVGVMWIKETREHYGFSLVDGSYLWGPTEPQYYLDSVDDSASDVRSIAYGKLYSASVGGICYCYDVKNGTRLWQYAAADPYTEFFWSNNWWLKPVFICDGNIYLGHTEHSVNTPMPRGAPFICLNATTGEEIWRINGAFRQTRWGGRAIIGDSIIATMDTYDQRVYAIGKGPSATTVSIQNDVITHGGSVLVKGMVTDISPGTQEYSKTARFPNGVPAVADENQSDWMLYVYKQFERPADAVGVEVVISVLDPNNNCYEVGRATSDATGFYSYAFTPQVPGKYTIYASFEGSGAYYGSSAETAINVDSAPAETPAPTPTPAPMTDTYVMGFGIAMVIAIIVIGLVIILMLRKR